MLDNSSILYLHILNTYHEISLTFFLVKILDSDLYKKLNYNFFVNLQEDGGCG